MPPDEESLHEIVGGPGGASFRVAWSWIKHQWIVTYGFLFGSTLLAFLRAALSKAVFGDAYDAVMPIILGILAWNVPVWLLGVSLVATYFLARRRRLSEGASPAPDPGHASGPEPELAPPASKLEYRRDFLPINQFSHRGPSVPALEMTWDWLHDEYIERIEFLCPICGTILVAMKSERGFSGAPDSTLMEFQCHECDYFLVCSIEGSDLNSYVRRHILYNVRTGKFRAIVAGLRGRE